MLIGRIVRLWAAAAVLAVSACGGGDAAPGGQAAEFAAEAAAASRTGGTAKRALALPPRQALAAGAGGPVDASAMLAWVEWKFPTLFPKGPASFELVADGVRFTVRSYPTGNHLGITADGAIWGLGVFTAQVLTYFGRISDYAAMVSADKCSVDPASCPNALNECQPLTTSSLVTGTRVHVEYQISGAIQGPLTLDFAIEGPSSFAGRSAIAMSYSQSGITAADYRRIYLADAGNGLVSTLGEEGLTAPSGGAVTYRTVYDPPYINSEYTLAPGGHFSRTITGTTTPLSPPGSPFIDSESETVTFVRRESITVFGRVFDTCRYTEEAVGSAPVTFWYHVGTGIPVRFDVGGGFSVVEMKEGSINGTPL